MLTVEVLFWRRDRGYQDVLDLRWVAPTGFGHISSHRTRIVDGFTMTGL